MGGFGKLKGVNADLSSYGLLNGDYIQSVAIQSCLRNEHKSYTFFKFDALLFIAERYLK